MTDHDPLDELASAHLDGATTPEEAARVAADPALLARVEELRAVRDALAQPLAADPDRREHAITAALAVYDAEADTTPAAATLAPVRSMTPIATRRGAGRSWRVVGVAAAVAALVALVPVIASLSEDTDDGSSDNMASAPETATQEQPEVADTTAPTEAAVDSGAITSTTAAEAAPQALGTYEDDDELVAAARSATPTVGAVPPETAGTFSSEPDPASCVDELVAALPAGTIVSLTGTATVDGAPVSVVVTPDEVRIAGGDCTDVTIRPR